MASNVLSMGIQISRQKYYLGILAFFFAFLAGKFKFP
jgi:hypothetical protein